MKLIGHSFGCNTATILAARNPNLVAELNLIAPAFDQLEAHRNIMRIAIEDFKLSSPDIALKLNQLIASSKTPFDASIREGMSLAFQDPALLSHYWQNKNMLMESLKCLGSPEAQVDLNAFFEVTEDFTTHFLPQLLNEKLELPTRVFFAGEDPVQL